MGKFRLGTASMSKLATCHPLLQDVIEEAMLRTPMDFTVVQGFRNKADQNAAVKAGKSQTPWPTSKHNHMDGPMPASLAVDVAPWWPTAPHIQWSCTEEFRWLAGFIMGVGSRIVEPKGYRLRWGGDWDQDGNHHDSKFIDLPHIELVPL